MEILLIIINIFLNIISVILYIMPFGLFDSVSYFINIYSNGFVMLLIFLLTTFLGFLFIIYLFELLNIPINMGTIKGVKLTDEELKTTPTLLSETMAFVLGKSNIATYYPVLITFISQVKLKIVPLLIVLIFLYIPLFPNTRGYNTVGEFFFSNSDIVIHQIKKLGGSSEAEDEDIERKVQFGNLIANQELTMDSKHFFKNDSLIIGQIDANTLKDDNINKLINQQISLYKNVYNDESYNKYIETLTKEINENKALLESELTKYNNTSSEQEQRRIKSNMNGLEEKITQLENDKRETQNNYSSLKIKISADRIKNDLKSKQDELIEKEITSLIYTDILDSKNGKITADELTAIYTDIQKVIDGDKTITFQSNKSLLINKLYKYNKPDITGSGNTISNKEYLSKMKNIIEKQKGKILSSESALLDEDIKRYSIEIGELSTQITNIEQIDKAPKARLEYAIDEIAQVLSTKQGELSDNEKQIYYLLQYNLIKESRNEFYSPETMLLFGNKIQYNGVNVFSGFTLLLTILNFLYTLFTYVFIILLAGWKNILILYISLLNAINTYLIGFLGEENKTTENLKLHVQKVTTNFFGEDEDKEYKWFKENNTQKETYMLIVFEFVARVGLIYAFFNY